MQMMAHNPSKKKTGGVGPSKEVAEEMIHRTSKKDKSKFMKTR